MTTLEHAIEGLDAARRAGWARYYEERRRIDWIADDLAWALQHLDGTFGDPADPANLRGAIREIVRAIRRCDGLDDARIDQRVQKDRNAMPSISRRRRVTDALLQQVAEIVKNNVDAPTRAVAEQMFTSHRNATRWITAARERGFLTNEEISGTTAPATAPLQQRPLDAPRTQGDAP